MRFGLGLTVLAMLLPVAEVAAAPTNSVTITDLSGSAAGRPFTISRFFAQSEIRNYAQPQIGGVAIPAWQCDVMNRWPDGSLKHALVSFRATLSANGSVKVDFVNNTAASSSGSPLTQQQMLDFNAGGGNGSWGAAIQVTSGSTLTANVRTMLAAGSWRYWLKGPVVTQIIVEDRTSTLTYDMGWDTYKPLHPIFVLTFYAGTPGVKTEYILENCWATKLKDVSYSLALKSGPALLTTRYTKGTFTQTAMTRWRKVFWDGTEPNKSNVNYNLEYITYSKALSNYDLSKLVSSSAVSAEISDFNGGDRGDINGNGQFLKYFPTTGGRGDIGNTPRWNVRYLFTFAAGLYDVVVGNGAVSGHVPIHVRESNPDTSKKFCANSCTAANAGAEAFGRPLSIDARRTIWIERPDWGATTAEDALRYVGSAGSAGWTVDLAHQADFVYIPYLITGDWYFLEESYFWSSYNLAASNPDSVAYGRHFDWGYLAPHGIQTRGTAWSLRTLANTSFLAPDGTPEKDYYNKKLQNNIAIWEGSMGIRDGAYPSQNPTCSNPNLNTDKWCFGFVTVNGRKTNPLFFLSYNTSDNRLQPSNFGWIAPNTASATDAPWQQNFLQLVLGHAAERFPQAVPLQRAAGKNLTNQLANPAFNPWMINAYFAPVLQYSPQFGGGNYFASWAQAKAAYIPSWQNATFWANSDDSLSDVEHGYTQIARAAASFLPGIVDGSVTGQAAWNWINDPACQVSTQAGLNNNPKWALTPRAGGGSAPLPVPCDLTNDRVINTTDVSLSVDKALGRSSCSAGDAGDIDRNGACNVVDIQRIVNAVLTGTCRVGP